MSLPAESGDLIERIGRTFDAYRSLSQEIVGLVVSPEADLEIKRLLRKRPDQHLAVFTIDQHMIPYAVDKTMLGIEAFKLKTSLNWTTPQMAIARFGATRSRLTNH